MISLSPPPNDLVWPLNSECHLLIWKSRILFKSFPMFSVVPDISFFLVLSILIFSRRYAGRGESRFTLVRMENNTITNQL